MVLQNLRRLGAFVIDLAVWTLIVTVLTNIYPVDINYWPESVFMVVLLVGVILLDSISLAWLKTSLGRWLFGVEVKSNFVIALQVNMLFWLLLGFATSTLLVVVGLAFMVFDYSQNKSWIWDRALGIAVEVKAVSKVKLAIGIILVLAIALGFYLTMDYDDGLGVSSEVVPLEFLQDDSYDGCGVVLLHNLKNCVPGTQELGE